MASNVKNGGMTLVDIIVAMVILSIGVLGFVSVTLTTNKLTKRANTNDIGYAIAKDRLAVLQNGDIPLRWTNSGTIIRDNIAYTINDTIRIDTVSDTKVAHVYVSWNNPISREVTLSGYMIREMCPDQSGASPTAINFDVDEIPLNTPSTYTLGTVTIDDPDIGDQHLLILDSSVADNRMYRLVHHSVQTAVAHTVPGDYKIVLTAIDCDENEIERSFVMTVPDADPVPYFTCSLDLDADENSARGAAIDTLTAFPDTVSFQLISQSHTVAVAIDPATGVVTVEDDTLYNHEQLSEITVLASVSNGAGADTAEFILTVNDVNEVPTAINLSGGLAHVSEGAYSAIGVLSTEDPDTNEISFSYFLDDPTPGYFRIINDTLTTNAIPLVAGFYDIFIETRDKGNLSYIDTFNIEIRDTTTVEEGSCGSYEEWNESLVYNVAGTRVYYGNNVFSSRSWTLGDTPAVNSSKWYYIESCDGEPLCADFPYYSRYNTYDYDTFVYWKKDASGDWGNTIFHAKRWVGTNRKPHKSSSSSYWEEIEECF